MESFLHPQPHLLTRKPELPVHTSALQQAEETWVSQDRHVFLPSKWVEVKAWLQGKDGDACSVMHGCVSRDILLQKDFIAHILSSPLCLPGTTGESVGVTSGAGTETTSGAPLTGVTSGNPAGKTERVHWDSVVD